MATTYLTVRQSMKRGMMPTASPDNPMGNSQKYMAYIMPFFALTGLYWPFGLVLYWVTTNVWTLIQQWALFKRYPYTPPSADGTVAATARLPRARSGARALPRPKQARRRHRPRSVNELGGQGLRGERPRPTPRRAAPTGQNGEPRPPGQRVEPRPGPATGGERRRRLGPRHRSGSGGRRMLRKLGRGRGRATGASRSQPEVKLVRQQRQRQSRSKRSGKR